MTAQEAAILSARKSHEKRDAELAKALKEIEGEAEKGRRECAFVHLSSSVERSLKGLGYGIQKFDGSADPRDTSVTIVTW